LLPVPVEAEPNPPDPAPAAVVFFWRVNENHAQDRHNAPSLIGLGVLLDSEGKLWLNQPTSWQLPCSGKTHVTSPKNRQNDPRSGTGLSTWICSNLACRSFLPWEMYRNLVIIQTGSKLMDETTASDRPVREVQVVTRCGLRNGFTRDWWGRPRLKQSAVRVESGTIHPRELFQGCRHNDEMN